MKEKKGKFYIKLLFILSIIFILLGITLILLSFRKEVLDDKYIVKDYTEYKSPKVSPENGEIVVTKDIEYMGEGIFKLTYINSSSNISLLKGTYFYITDMYNKEFKVLNTNIYVNDIEYKFPKHQVSSKEGIRVNCINNVLDIELPNDILANNNNITIYVQLISKKLNKNNYISQDTYYTLIPSKDNNFYKKKTSQSYVIEGNSYIIIDEK